METHLTSEELNDGLNLTNVAENVANSVLDCSDMELKAENLRACEQVKFEDGFELINAFKSLYKPKTVLNNNNSTNIEQKWQIWYWQRKTEPRSKNWPDCLQMKSSFSNRKEFWSSYNEVNGYEFGLLSRHFDYCVFKDGIKPMWEDTYNLNGGRWILEFPRKKDWRHISFLDEIWLKVLISITGGNQEISQYIEEICGAVLMIRYSLNKIAVWTKNSNNTLVNLKIGELLKESTGFTGKMYYTSHDSTVKKIVVKAKQHRIKFNDNRLEYQYTDREID